MNIEEFVGRLEKLKARDEAERLAFQQMIDKATGGRLLEPAPPIEEKPRRTIRGPDFHMDEAPAAFDRLMASPFADTLRQIYQPSVTRLNSDNGIYGPGAIVGEYLYGPTRVNSDDPSGPRLPARDTVELRPFAVSGWESGVAPYYSQGTDAEWVLAHEYGHGYDYANRGSNQRAKQGFEAAVDENYYTPLYLSNDSTEKAKRKAKNQYANEGRNERAAQVFANAVDFLRATSNMLPNEVARIRGEYEAEVPGTTAAVVDLLRKPIYSRHPLNLSRMDVKPDKTAVRPRR